VYDRNQQSPEHRLSTKHPPPAVRRPEVGAVSAQQRLDGSDADPRDLAPPPHARTGYAAVLWQAPKETEWSRVAAWCRRADAEGVV
jgi:hypothetical protein